MHIHEVKDMDKALVIDPVTRTIIGVPKQLVQGDHNSEVFTFLMPQYIEGHDMLQCTKVQVHYNNVEKNAKTYRSGVYEVDDLGVNAEGENQVVFTWKISGNATQLNGSLDFAITFECLTDTEIDYSWNTLIRTKDTVGEGMNNSEEVVEMYADVLVQWEQKILDEMKDSAGTIYVDETLTEIGKAADAKVVGEKFSQLSQEKVDNPSTGAVGQILEIESVDEETGKPKTYKAVDKPSGGVDVSKITAYDAGVVKPFRRYDTLFDEVNPLFVTKHLNERVANNEVEIINDGATVHEVNGVLSPDGKRMYISYLKNIEGTTADVGNTSESGGCKIFLKTAYNAYGVTRFTPTISSTEVELFAKGQELEDGTTIDTGGPACPMLYSDGTTLFAVCLFAGGKNKGYVRTADISGSPKIDELVWSKAQPWTLSIDGEIGDYNMNRLNGWTNATWQTNNQIQWISAINMFVMAVCVNDKGVVLLKSSDGINWNYTNTVFTDYLCKFQCEAAVFRQSSSNIWIAVRNGNTTTSTSKLACGNENYLTVFKVNANGVKLEEYNIPDTGVKPWFIPFPSATCKGAYLLHNAQSRYSIQIEYIEEYYPAMTLGEMYGIATNYCTGVVPSTVAINASMILMGTNSLVTEQKGASLIFGVVLGEYVDGSKSLDLLKKIVTKAIDSEVTQDSANLVTSGAVFNAMENYVPPVATKDALGSVKPAEKTGEMSQPVGVDANGGLWTQGVAPATWSLFKTVTVESGADKVTIAFDNTPKKIVITGIVKADTNATLNVLANTANWDYADSRVAQITNGINTNASKRFVLIMEKVASKRWLIYLSSSVLEGTGFTNMQVRSLIIDGLTDLTSLVMLSATSGQTFTGGTLEVYTQ